MTDQLAADGVDDEPRGVDDDPTDGSDAVDPIEDGGEPSDGEAAPKGRRVSRWDRPPAPRDWRFYVGGTGKVLIATGLLLFGFVAYQLWGTGIETARTQNQLENEFETLLSEFGDTPDADPSSGDSPAVGVEEDAPPAADSGAEPGGGASDNAPVNDPAVRSDDDDPAADPTAGTDADTAASAAEADTATASAIPVAVDLADRAVVQDPIPQPFRGDPLIRLEIPAIGRDDIVVPGVGLEDLKDGPGHYPDTPLPGQLGNAAIAGHRTTYGAPFYDVDRLEAGDEIITTLLNGDRFVYEVTHVEVVGATDYWVVTTTNPNIAELTLTSCHPKYTARDRIVVHSVLNPAKSSNVGVPTFYELESEPDPEQIPGDDPVLVAAEAIEVTEPPAAGASEDDAAPEAIIDADPTDGSSAAADPSTVSGDDTAAESATDAAESGTEATASDATAARATAATATAAPTPVDAFEQGWFHDAGAFPQILLWALVLTLITVLAYQIAKRLRRVWVGVLVGTVPFLVALYFFYQNVNRLLPAGI